MKELSNAIKPWLEGLDNRWKQLPVKDTRRIVALSFGCYILITLAVLIQVVYQLSTSQGTMEIDHITNPVLKIIPEKKMYKPQTEDNESE